MCSSDLGMTTQITWDHRTFGLPKINNDDLLVSGPEESAERIREILRGDLGPSRDIVLANAAAGLWVCGKTHSLAGGVEVAKRAIDSGRARQLLAELATRTLPS